MALRRVATKGMTGFDGKHALLKIVRAHLCANRKKLDDTEQSFIRDNALAFASNAGYAFAV